MMRTSPYSIDLRDKVIEYLKAGNTQQSAIKLFGLNQSTINRWYLREKREGHCRPRARIGKKPGLDVDELKNYMKKNGDQTTTEIGKYFGMRGVSIWHWLKKLGYSYKKNSSPMWSLIEVSKKSL